MSLKTIFGTIWKYTKKIVVGICKAIRDVVVWICKRISRWFIRTRAKISRVYLVYSCFMSGVIGFFKSIKSQHNVWKIERQEYLYPNEPAFEHEVLPEE